MLVVEHRGLVDFKQPQATRPVEAERPGVETGCKEHDLPNPGGGTT